MKTSMSSGWEQSAPLVVVQSHSRGTRRWVAGLFRTAGFACRAAEDWDDLRDLCVRLPVHLLAVHVDDGSGPDPERGLAEFKQSTGGQRVVAFTQCGDPAHRTRYSVLFDGWYLLPQDGRRMAYEAAERMGIRAPAPVRLRMNLFDTDIGPALSTQLVLADRSHASFHLPLLPHRG
jgi:hypothetical protein